MSELSLASIQTNSGNVMPSQILMSSKIIIVILLANQICILCFAPTTSQPWATLTSGSLFFFSINASELFDFLSTNIRLHPNTTFDLITEVIVILGRELESSIDWFLKTKFV